MDHRLAEIQKNSLKFVRSEDNVVESTQRRTQSLFQTITEEKGAGLGMPAGHLKGAP
jgi:hypothetical protein